MSCQLNVKKLVTDAKLPEYAHPGDAACDLFISETITIKPNERLSLPTGIAIEIPYGYVGLIWDKSGISHKFGLKTMGGVIDAGYRGEVKVGMINLGPQVYTFEKGHKVAQMIIQKREECNIQEVPELNETERGSGGFGSTGK